MSEQKQKIYSTEFKEPSVKLAIESAQPIAHMASDSKAHSDNCAYDEIMKLKRN